MDLRELVGENVNGEIGLSQKFVILQKNSSIFLFIKDTDSKHRDIVEEFLFKYGGNIDDTDVLCGGFVNISLSDGALKIELYGKSEEYGIDIDMEGIYVLIQRALCGKEFMLEIKSPA